MKKLLSLTLCFCLIFLLIGLLPIHSEAEIYDSVIRLHVVANSNSDEDQALKLCVRDAILEQGVLLGKECSSIEDAHAMLQERLPLVLDCAKKEIERQGYDLDASVRLCREEYPQKSYGSLCFPSGEYLSLQVLIGEAEGENWWCVLFPPLCVDAAKKSISDEDAFVSVGLTPEQYKIITESSSPTYEARFKLLEVIEKVFS